MPKRDGTKGNQVKKTILIMIFLFFLSFTATNVHSSILSDAAAGLGPGEWIHLGTYSDLVSATDDEDQWYTFEYSFRLFWVRTGALGTGKMVHMGSGHTSGEWHLVEYDEATDSWSRNSSADLGCQIHSYDQWTVDRSNGDIYALCLNKSFQKWNGSAPWKSLTAWPGGYPTLMATAYFPDMGRIYAANGYSTNDELRSYDISSNSWVSSQVITNLKANLDMLYSPIAKKLVFGGGGDNSGNNLNIYTIDASGKVTETNTDTPQAWRVKTVLSDYDPVTGDIIFFFSADDTVRRYDIAADSMTTIGAYPANPPFSWEGGDTWGHGVIVGTIPDYNVIMIANDRTGAVWLYRPSAGVPPEPPGALKYPSVTDEKNTYTRWGWTWTSNQEPQNISEPRSGGYPSTVYPGNIHNDTEADDLWNYITMVSRGGSPMYLARAQSWVNYVVYGNYYSDLINVDQAARCHLYGWGALAWYEYSSDANALAKAEQIGDLVISFYSGATPGVTNMSARGNGARGGARHLILATELYRVTGKQKWKDLMDHLIDLWLQSPDWYDAPSGGFYHEGEPATNNYVGAGAYDAGYRICGAFYMALVADAFWRAYQLTDNSSWKTQLRSRLIGLADYYKDYGVYSNGYAPSRSGFRPDGTTWWPGGTPGSCDSAYTTSQVNTLVLGYKFTGDSTYLSEAKDRFDIGTHGDYNDGCSAKLGSTSVDHFLDTEFASASEYIFLKHNKGEFQYAYLIFENGGDPYLEDGGGKGQPPSPPTNLRIMSAP